MLAVLANQMELLSSAPLETRDLESNSEVWRGFQAGLIGSLARNKAILDIPKGLKDLQQRLCSRCSCISKDCILKALHSFKTRLSLLGSEITSRGSKKYEKALIRTE
jgi:hypothetical protein